eukprot:gene9372-9535_t
MKPGVRVLHRATGDDENPRNEDRPARPGNDGEQLQQLLAENESLKQRLEQTKASAVTEKKRLSDELRLERAGRERAEELLVKQAKELEAAAAAKGRLEEAFSRSMAELSAAGAPAGGKKLSKGKLLGELAQLRQAKAAADLSRDELLQRLGALEAEKERAEESQEMISRQTAQLLDDKRKLLKDLGSKDDEVRNMEAVLQHMQHQHDLACADRQLLLERLVQTGGIDSSEEMAALAAAMEAEGYVDQDDDATPCHVADLAPGDLQQNGDAQEQSEGFGH